MSSKCVLIIGVRRACYKAAIALGHSVVLWSDTPLSTQRTRKLFGWFAEPYSESANELSPKVLQELSKYEIQHVIANTEETVILGAFVRRHLGLKYLAVDVAERFHNKFVMKNCAKAKGIPITNYRLIESNTSAKELVQSLGLPVVVKPVDESGAQDIKVAKSLPELQAVMRPGLLAESFVYGSEASVETFIQDGKPVFHNITEYLHQWKKSVVPASFSAELQAEIIRINDLVIQSFGVDRGMTHAEFYLSPKGPIFGEVAIRPPGGYYMNLIQRVFGVDTWKLYVNLSCGVKVDPLNLTANGAAGVFMMHPGAGRVKAIRGVEEVRKQVKGIFDFSIRKEVGDEISEHENTSNEVGHILFWAPDRATFDADLAFMEANIVFEME